MKLVMKYGILVGVGSFAWLLAEYFLGFRTTHFGTHLITTFFSVIVLITGIVLALHARREELGKGFRFKDGFMTGLGVSLVAGIVMVFGLYFYLGVVDRDYSNRAKAWGVYVQVLDGTPLETAQANAAAGAWKRNIHVLALYQIPVFVVQGGIVSAVATGVMMKRRR